MDVTKIWQLYESGMDYNNRLEPNYYDMLDLNIEYSEGNQWLMELPEEFLKPVFNFEKRVINLFTSVLCSANTAISIEPFQTIGNEEQVKKAEMLKAAVESYFKMTNFDAFKRECIEDVAKMGDILAHYLFDPDKKTVLGERGEIVREAVYGYNVFPGNPTTHIFDEWMQPYILVSGREFVYELKQEAEANGMPTDQIHSDEVDGSYRYYEESSADNYKMATCVYKYTFEDDKVLVSKSTVNQIIYEDVEINVDKYPGAWLIWEKQINKYHGRALVQDMHDAQDYINQSFALMMYHTMALAYGRPIYDADRIQGWTSDITQALSVKGLQPGQRVTDFVGNITPSTMSTMVIQGIELAINVLKEVLGLTDAMMGNVRPDNKGAIMMATKNSQMPLENQLERIRQWTEQQVMIVANMMINKYGTRKVLMPTKVTNEDGTVTEGMELVDFDFGSLKDVPLNINVEIGEASAYSEIGIMQSLDNLFNSQILDVIQYLERYPDGQIPDKQGLIDDLKARMKPTEPQNEQALIQKFESLTPDQQSQIQALPQEQQAEALRQL